jgi:hypothetical protein
MELYDYVIGAFKDHLCILKRNGNRVKEKRIPYQDIAAVRRLHALLKGELLIYLPSEVIRIVYNTVSDDIILRLMRIVLNNISGAIQDRVELGRIPVEYGPENTAMDLYYVNLCNRIGRVFPELFLVAYQPEIVLERIRQGNFYRMKFRKLRMTKTAFLSDGKIIAVRGSEITTRNKTADKLAYDYLLFTIQSITDIRVDVFDKKEKYQRLEIIMGNNVFGYIYETINANMGELAEKLRKTISLP